MTITVPLINPIFFYFDSEIAKMLNLGDIAHFTIKNKFYQRFFYYIWKGVRTLDNNTQDYNAGKVISEVYASFVLQFTGW